MQPHTTVSTPSSRKRRSRSRSGINDFAGQSIWLEAHYPEPGAGRSAQDAVSIERFGALTAGFPAADRDAAADHRARLPQLRRRTRPGVLAQRCRRRARPAAARRQAIGAGAAILTLVAPLIVIGALSLAVDVAARLSPACRGAAADPRLRAYAAIWLLLTVSASP